MRGDYKHGKVKDPTAKLDSRHSKTVRKFVKEFMDKAVQKKEAREKEKAAKQDKKLQGKPDGGLTGVSQSPQKSPKPKHDESDDEMFGFSDNEAEESNQVSPADSSSMELKRKREEEGDVGSPKKSRIDTMETSPTPPPPPPPPPPPADDEFEMEGSSSTPLEYGDLQGSPGTEMLIRNRLKQGGESPMQLATPPTTTNGSCEHDSNVKDGGLDTKSNGDTQPIPMNGCS